MAEYGIIAAIIFFILFVGAALLVFSMVKRTLKLAFRLAIVAVLLLVAVVGAMSLWWFSGKPQPNANKPAVLRPAR